MSFVAFVEIVNLVLASLAALISLGILKKVASNLAQSWRYSLIAFQMLALATLFTTLHELGFTSLGGIDTYLLSYTAHFFFIILAFLGLYRYYQLLRGLSRRGA